MRPILAIILGVVIGMVAMFILLSGVHKIYAPAEQKDADGNVIQLEGEAAAAYIASLPLPAFLLVLAAHQLGTLVGGAAAVLVSNRRWMTGALVTGVIFLVAGVANMLVLPPHPLWFMIADIVLYLPAALLGGWIACRLLPEPPAYSMDDIPPHLRRRRR